MNKLEITGIKLVLARIKSKSPSGYALATHISGGLAAICALYIMCYQTGGLAALFPASVALLGKINSLCIVGGAALTSVGLTSMTTTTDPSLLCQEVHDNFAQAATDVKAVEETVNEKKK